jgi:hypothetical protein
MNKTFNLILISILFSSSCERKEKYVESASINLCADQLIITVDDSRIYIDSESPNCYLEDLSKDNNYPAKINFDITKSGRDSIFSNAKKLIVRTNYILRTKTDYAGQNFNLTLQCPNQTHMFYESSVSNWSEISVETQTIFSIIKRKIDIVK